MVHAPRVPCHCPSSAPYQPPAPAVRRSAPHVVSTQLAETFKAVAYCDYPEAWPQLLPELHTNLTSTVRAGDPASSQRQLVPMGHAMFGTRDCQAFHTRCNAH